MTPWHLRGTRGENWKRAIAATAVLGVCTGAILTAGGCTIRSSDSSASPSSDSSQTTVTSARDLKIMPLGDSITDGYNVPGGYRIDLWTHLHERGYRVDFVGTQTNGPPELPDRDHQGHSGWRIDQIHANVVRWLGATQPSLVLLIIGTNDMAQGYDLDRAPDRLSRLLDDIFRTRPQAQVFVGSLPPIDAPELDARVRRYNQAIAELIQQRQDAGDRLIFVDLYPELTADDLADGIHPNREGHRKIARMWDRALAETLAPPTAARPSE